MSFYEWVLTEIKNNEFFSAALGGSVTYAVLGYLRSTLLYIYHWLKSLFIRELTISGCDASETVRSFNKFCAAKITHPKNIKITNSNEKLLSYGTNWFFYNWYTYCTIQISKEENNHTELNVENMTLSILSIRARAMRAKLNDEIAAFLLQETLSKPGIYNITGGYSQKIRPLPSRPLNSIFVHDSVKDLIVDNISNVINNDSLERLGLPQTLGILLYGKPGTGKSSIITAVANEFKANIFYAKLHRDTDLSEIAETLQTLPTSVKSYPIFLALEDIDSCPIFTERKDSDTEALKTTPLSEALRMLDGQDMPPNTIIFATTNHVDRLDPAVKRAGRFDLKIEIGPADREIATNMVKYIDEEQIAILDEIEFPITQAELQAKLIRVSKFSGGKKNRTNIGEPNKMIYSSTRMNKSIRQGSLRRVVNE